MKTSNGIRPRKANTLLQGSLFANVFFVNSFVVNSFVVNSFVINSFVINSFVINSFVINGLLAVCIPTVLYAFSSNLSDDAAKVNQLGYIGISAREQVVL